MAYLDLAPSHEFADFDFINDFSPNYSVIKYRCGLTHISTERSNVDFSLLLFGINFESRLTRKKASQAKKCAQLCVMEMCKICHQIYKKTKIYCISRIYIFMMIDIRHRFHDINL